MKVLIDTNVVFDVFARRQPHYSASNHILKLARRKKIAAAVAAHTVANLFYFYQRPAVAFLREDLLPNVEVAAADSFLTLASLNLGMPDLEDALQVGAALDWKAAFIITRNVRHFKKSNVPAMTPVEWIKRFEPAL
ncbi:MAG: PIN domain-containing protein [Verrucomicrobiota bacterium]|nr:PIN domain-containing protein [Verrucomicrobiota bacterium]MCC6822513.1 PIN domain-containing protein [Limisphaerales bacterium]